MVAAWDRNVTVLTISKGAHAADIPCAVARSEDCQLGMAIAVVIRRDRDITVRTVSKSAYSMDVPGAIARTEDGKFSRAIAVVIRRNRLI